MSEPGAIRIACVCGSVRPGNYTSKALALVADEFAKHGDVSVTIIDPATITLPMPGIKSENPSLLAMQQTMRDAIGIVMATPEYHGGMSSVIKLVIENLGHPSGLKGKPVALLGVAAGVIGAIKSTEQLRSVCSHVGALVLPGTVSVPRVDKVFDEAGRCLDAAVEARVRGLATSLLDYLRKSVCPWQSFEESVRQP